MTDYEDLAFEPPLTWEELKEWAKSKEGVNVRDTEIEVMRKKVDVKVYGDRDMGESDAYMVYGGRPTLDAFFAGTPAQVKRVLEALLGD